LSFAEATKAEKVAAMTELTAMIRAAASETDALERL
jgi:hypothetical protein